MKLPLSTTSKENSIFYEVSSENFVWTQDPKEVSPMVISVCHNGMHKNDFTGLFNTRKNGSKLDDLYVWPLVKGISWKFPAHIVRGLIPRYFVDYNRHTTKYFFNPDTDLLKDTEFACEDDRLAPFHEYFHQSVCDRVNESKSVWGRQALFIDFHGYRNQPPYGEYDVILGTANTKTVLENEDHRLSEFLRQKGYKVFLPMKETVSDGTPDTFDAGFTTRNVFSKTGVTSIQIEVHASIRTDSQKAIKFSREFRELLNDFYPTLKK